jgi:hypothetical protein
MEDNPRWEKKKISCPESMRPAYLMVEWRMQKDGRDVISSVHCDNPNLHNLGGGDCTWSCWEKLS